MTFLFHLRIRGFTTAELLVAMAASSLILAGLIASTTSLSRSFRATESYARTQSAQIRLLDSLALDLRRSIAVSITTSPTSDPDASGNYHNTFRYNGANPALNTRTIRDGTFNYETNRPLQASAASTYLSLTLPGYYRSNTPASPDYREVNTLISVRNAVRFGTSAGLSPTTVVQYRKAYHPQYGSECYIRREAGVDRVVVEKADNMDIDITAQPNNSFIIDSWFIPLYSVAGFRSTARVTSSDRVMLRSARTD